MNYPTARQAGAAAFREGLHSSYNPHPMGSGYSYDWISGFEEARRDAREETIRHQEPDPRRDKIERVLNRLVNASEYLSASLSNSERFWKAKEAFEKVYAETVDALSEVIRNHTPSATFPAELVELSKKATQGEWIEGEDDFNGVVLTTVKRQSGGLIDILNVHVDYDDPIGAEQKANAAFIRKLVSWFRAIASDATPYAAGNTTDLSHE